MICFAGSASTMTNCNWVMKCYGVNILVWYEIHEDVDIAIEREKQIKGWNRAWKVRLIEQDNSDWNDLAPGLM
jgi:putative endonuclease